VLTINLTEGTNGNQNSLIFKHGFSNVSISMVLPYNMSTGTSSNKTFQLTNATETLNRMVSLIGNRLGSKAITHFSTLPVLLVMQDFHHTSHLPETKK
jgi:hypothetical protein